MAVTADLVTVAVGEVAIRRAAVAAVVAASLALGAGAGARAWASREQEARRDARTAVLGRLDGPLAAVHEDAAARASATVTVDGAGVSALLVGTRATLAATAARARAVLDGSAGEVPDDAVRTALAERLQAVDAAGAGVSVAAARRLTAEVTAAEAAVQAAVADDRDRRATQAATRATTPPPRPAPAAAASDDDRCATTYHGPAFFTSPPTEGGDGSNGRLPASALTAVGWTRDSRGTPFYLRSDAAAALERLNAAFRDALGHDLALDLTYRDLDTQVAMREALGSVAAVPGTSSHGTGLALDVPELPCEYGWDTAAREWLVTHGPSFGWVSPGWARQGGSNPEYWHYEYRG